MLLTGIELQGGQANIEGTSATLRSEIRSEIRTDSPGLLTQFLYYKNVILIFLLFRSSHCNDNKEGLKFVPKLSRD